MQPVRPASTCSPRLIRGRPTPTLGPSSGRLPHCQVGHEMVGRGAMPVPLARRRVDRVAGADLEQLPAASLHPADSLSHVKCLAERMGMPGVARARREADDVDPDTRRRCAAGEAVHPHVADEDVRRSLGRGLPWIGLPYVPPAVVLSTDETSHSLPAESASVHHLRGVIPDHAPSGGERGVDPSLSVLVRNPDSHMDSPPPRSARSSFICLEPEAGVAQVRGSTRSSAGVSGGGRIQGRPARTASSGRVSRTGQRRGSSEPWTDRPGQIVALGGG